MAPLVVVAQRPEVVRRVGVLSPGPAAGAEFQDILINMQAFGWIEGKNILVESRSASANLSRLLAMADELAALKVDVIVTYGTEAATAAKKATTSIPIVMASSGDPVSAGLITSLARPGGNITGYSLIYPDVAAKRAALLREVLPNARRVYVLTNPIGSASRRLRASTEEAYRSLGIESFVIEVAEKRQFLHAIAEAARNHADALDINLALPLTDDLMHAALHSRLPTMVSGRDAVEAGGLISFLPDIDEGTRRVAAIVDKVLRGVRAADLPVEQPTKFQLVVNLKTAKVLGLTIPKSVVLRADDVIN